MSDDLHILPHAGERCRQLLSKGIYINYGLPPGDEAAGEGNIWCGRTQRIYGPDDRLCGHEECSDPGRSCYEGL